MLAERFQGFHTAGTSSERARSYSGNNSGEMRGVRIVCISSHLLLSTSCVDAIGDVNGARLAACGSSFKTSFAALPLLR
jgi:hypothetical protein